MKKTTLITILLSISVLVLVALTGCGKATGDSSNREDTNQNGYYIFVCPIVQNEYWQDCIAGMREADEELGTTTEVMGPDTAENYQTEIVEHMKQAISKKPDGIILYAGISELAPLINEATEDGITVLAIDSDAPETERVAYVGSDAYNAGYKAGQTMVGLTNGTGKIGVLISSKSADKEMDVVNAFKDAVSDYNMKVVEYKEVNADPALAEQKTRELLQEYPEMNAVFCTVGFGVTGAARAKKALGRDDLRLVGFDDVKENLQFVKEGVINSILVQRINETGYQSVYLMHECLKDGSLPKEYYDTGTILVSKDNVNTYKEKDDRLQETGKVVRVGYYTEDKNFQSGTSDEDVKSGYAYDYYQEIADFTGWQYKYIYGSRNEMMNKLETGEVDIVAGVHKTSLQEERFIFSEKDMGLLGEPQYFAINQSKPDLLEDINYAMEEIDTSSPNFVVNLRLKYNQQSSLQVLSDREREWIDQKQSLKIGYVEDNMPLSDVDSEGNPDGLAKDVIDYMVEHLRIEIKPLSYASTVELEEALEAEEIDMAFPIYTDRWTAESNGFRITDSFVSDRAMMAYKGEFDEDLLKKMGLCVVAVGEGDNYSRYYSDAEIVCYESVAKAFSRVYNGSEQCIVGSSGVFQRFIGQNPKYSDLKMGYIDIPVNYSIAVAQDNPLLAGILNKCIRSMDEVFITSALMQYTNVEPEYTIFELIRKHSLFFILILAVIAGIILMVFVSYRKQTKLFNIEQEKSKIALEEALDAVQVASEAKTKFLSSMSHDIRTPMNAIVGMTAIAMQNMQDKEKVENCLKKITTSSHHLLALINDVLDISKIESGNMTLNPVTFSLTEFIDTLMDIVMPLVKDKNQQFKLNVHDLEADMVRADDVRINQVFINLLSNAVKYTPAGGTVSMEFSGKIIHPEDGGKDILKTTFIVEDNGIGMSEDFMEVMYEVFSRKKDSRINKIQGTGLGLSIVRQMVDIMGGTIDCESKVEEGTKFTVVLDMEVSTKTSEDVESSEAAIGGEKDIRKLHLLIAEDNDINWEVVSELLRSYGITADRAENGRICVDMLSEASPGTYDMILMDIQMPEMNGRDATKLIRADEREYINNIPIIALTADAFSEDIAESLEAGMNGHVSKPIDINNLVQEIKRLSNGINHTSVD